MKKKGQTEPLMNIADNTNKVTRSFPKKKIIFLIVSMIIIFIILLTIIAYVLLKNNNQNLNNPVKNSTNPILNVSSKNYKTINNSTVSKNRTISCSPSCVNKQCGDNGCGGSCGGCSPSNNCKISNCISGNCSETNKPDGTNCTINSGLNTLLPFLYFFKLFNINLGIMGTSNGICSSGICNQIDNSCTKIEGSICQSYEVCDGNILSASDLNRCCKGVCKLPKRFDWRQRHGQNWITPVKNQGNANTCGFFAEVSSLESNINLYYNQLLNLDLSEQFFISCQYPGDLINDNEISIINNCTSSKDYGFLGSDGCLIFNFGITDENCAPYTDFYLNCSSSRVCADWRNRLWKPSTVEGYSRYKSLIYPLKQIESIDDIKKLLIEKGPFELASLSIDGHAVTLIGYYDENNKTFFTFKNSWGSDQDYFSEEVDFSKISNFNIFIGPFTPPNDKSFWPSGFDNEVKCVDLDNDSFCNWGIVSRPDTCPSSCKSKEDWDDSNSSIGALVVY